MREDCVWIKIIRLSAPLETSFQPFLLQFWKALSQRNHARLRGFCWRCAETGRLGEFPGRRQFLELVQMTESSFGILFR